MVHAYITIFMEDTNDIHFSYNVNLIHTYMASQLQSLPYRRPFFVLIIANKYIWMIYGVTLSQLGSLH